MNITIGQEAAVCHMGSWAHHYYFGYVVAKVTPTGQVTIKRNCDGYERKFDKNGREMGTSMSKWNRDTVCFNVEELRQSEQAKKRAERAAEAIKNVCVIDSRGTYGKEALLEQIAELEEKLAAARAAVNEI